MSERDRRRDGIEAKPNHLLSPDEVQARLDFALLVAVTDWPGGVRADRYVDVPAGEVDLPAESHARLTLQKRHAGRLRLAWGGAETDVPAGDWQTPLVTLTPPGVETRWAWGEGNESFSLLLPPTLLDGGGKGIGGGGGLRADTGTPRPLLGRLLATLELMVREPDEACPLAVGHLTEAVAAQLRCSHGHEPPTPTPGNEGGGGGGRVGPLGEAAVRKVESYLREHLDERVAGSDLAGALGCSEAHLRKAYKRATGVTPSARLRRLRAERAVELLRSPAQATGAQVAAAVGLSSASHLAKVVRRETGHDLASVRDG